MNKRPKVVHLPTLDPFLDRKTDSVKQTACKMYAKVITFLDKHLSDNFLQILNQAAYQFAGSHLNACKKAATLTQKKLNKKVDTERTAKNHQLLISHDYKADNEKTGKLMKMFLN